MHTSFKKTLVMILEEKANAATIPHGRKYGLLIQNDPENH